MVYAVNEEGVDALKSMASAIITARDEIESCAKKLKAACDAENMGPHAASLIDAAASIEEAIKDAGGPIDEISESLNSVAEEYEEIIGDDVLAGIGGFAAAGALGAAAGMAAGTAGVAAGTSGSAGTPGAGSGRSGFGGGYSAGVAHSSQSLAEVQGWIKDINPNFDPYDYNSPYGSNCGTCALAVFSRLNGSQTATATANTLSIPDMNSATGRTQTRMSPDQIKQTILSGGAGSHAVVGVDRAVGPGHWFNIFTPDGQNVYTIDGQTGTISGWPPDYGNVVVWDMSI